MEEGGYLRAIFDFDGTLARLKVDWAEVRRTLEAIYGSMGGKPLFAWVRERFLGGLEVGPILEVVRRAEVEGLRGLEFDRGVVELLWELKGRGGRLALVSMQDDGVLAEALRLMGAVGLFDLVVGRRTELLRERQLLAVASFWGVPPSEVFFVTDRVDDAELGRSLGFRSLRLTFRDGSVAEWLRGLLAGVY
ncbi:hypothetical protein B6U99_02220 [Candidatus Geothermarchaeota archaeon ex4572_27]|nr:MAG: hypothetical protein B6U99_02220 [Candidatus Geothermarchaeota archaeon ex4572_27]